MLVFKLVYLRNNWPDFIVQVPRWNLFTCTRKFRSKILISFVDLESWWTKNAENCWFSRHALTFQLKNPQLFMLLFLARCQSISFSWGRLSFRKTHAIRSLHQICSSEWQKVVSPHSNSSFSKMTDLNFSSKMRITLKKFYMLRRWNSL